jgi:hypothetical protein
MERESGFGRARAPVGTLGDRDAAHQLPLLPRCALLDPNPPRVVVGAMFGFALTGAIAVDSTATDDVVLDGDVLVPEPVTLPPITAAQAVSFALPTTAAARAFTRGNSVREVVS